MSRQPALPVSGRAKSACKKQHLFPSCRWVSKGRERPPFGRLGRSGGKSKSPRPPFLWGCKTPFPLAGQRKWGFEKTYFSLCQTTLSAIDKLSPRSGLQRPTGPLPRRPSHLPHVSSQRKSCIHRDFLMSNYAFGRRRGVRISHPGLKPGLLSLPRSSSSSTTASLGRVGVYSCRVQG